ncbi:MAG: ion channel [Rikenellaceae bacterium]
MKNLLPILNAVVIVASLAIIAFMSLEILSPDLIADGEVAVKFHFCVSLIFLLDFFVRMSRSKRKVRFLFVNLIFLLVSLPFLSFIEWFGWDVNKATEMIVRYLPFVRAIYGFMMVFRYITRSKITNLFYTYLVLVLATTYFSSLLFFSVEKEINPQVNTFGDALWWALMDMTTCGSNIVPYSSLGRVIAVVLAASGMMLFPIFTVFITDVFGRSILKDVES